MGGCFVGAIKYFTIIKRLKEFAGGFNVKKLNYGCFKRIGFKFGIGN